jgi:hypothetical protein
MCMATVTQPESQWFSFQPRGLLGSNARLLPNRPFSGPTETFEWLTPHTNLEQYARHNRDSDLYIAVPVPFCVPTHLERGALDSPGPRGLQDTHPLGADRLWATVHSNSKVPYSCPHCTVST